MVTCARLPRRRAIAESPVVARFTRIVYGKSDSVGAAVGISVASAFDTAATAAGERIGEYVGLVGE